MLLGVGDGEAAVELLVRGEVTVELLVRGEVAVELLVRGEREFTSEVVEGDGTSKQTFGEMKDKGGINDKCILDFTFGGVWEDILENLALVGDTGAEYEGGVGGGVEEWIKVILVGI